MTLRKTTDERVLQRKQAEIVVPNWEKRKKALQQRKNAPQKEQKRSVKRAKQAIRHYSKEKAGFRSGKHRLTNKKAQPFGYA